MKKKITVIVGIVVVVLAVGGYFAVDYFTGRDLENQQQALENLAVNSVQTASGETVETELYNFGDGEFFLKIPKDFGQMSQELIDIKYPNGNPPQFVFTNEETTINVAVSLTENYMEPGQIEGYLAAMEEALGGSVEMLETGVTETAGRTIGEMEFVSAAVDTDIYNHMLVFSEGNQLRIVSFNCTEELRAEWQPVGSFIIDSLRFPAEE